MKNILAILIIGLISWQAYGTNCHQDHSHSKKCDIKKSTTSRKILSDKDKQEVLLVFKENEKLHSAFFKYDGKKVEEVAKTTANLISKISNIEISKLLSFSQKKLLEIKADALREKNDKIYHLVSMALIHLINTYDIGNEYNAYSCSMKKMKWVQNSKQMAKVHNPYAPEMKHCGDQQTSY